MKASGGLRSLSVQGVALVIVQLAVTVGLPIAEWFLFYGDYKRFWYIPITTWGITGIAGLVGLAAMLSKAGPLLALHAALALPGAALLGWLNTDFYLGIKDKCALSQSSFAGCVSCTCAATSSCKDAAFGAAGACPSCAAVGTDVCALFDPLASILPWMGVIQAVLIALPAMSSLALLARVEAEAGSVLRKMAKIKLVLAEELARYDAGQPPLTPPSEMREIVRNVYKYGAFYDRQLAERGAAAFHVDIADLVAAREKPAKAPKAGGKAVLPLVVKVGAGVFADNGGVADGVMAAAAVSPQKKGKKKAGDDKLASAVPATAESFAAPPPATSEPKKKGTGSKKKGDNAV